MRLRVEHIGLAAKDPAFLRDWYVRVLGFEEVFRDRGNPAAYFLRSSAGLMIEIYPADSGNDAVRNNKLAGWRHLALRVESMETARAALAARGVEFTEEIRPAGGGGRVLFFSDVEGNLLHLVERPEGFDGE